VSTEIIIFISEHERLVSGSVWLGY